jgi:putative effector of murein hydrolase
MKNNKNFRKYVHPVFVTAAGTTSLLALSSFFSRTPFDSVLLNYYGSAKRFGAGDIISAMLVPSVVSFGYQLFLQRQLLRDNLAVIISSSFLSAFFGIFSSALLSRGLSLKPAAAGLSTLTRCVTSPLALVGAGLVGADPSLAALVVTLTGVTGASFGPAFLTKLHVRTDIARGLTMGASAHGIGTAACASNAEQFAAAVVSMTLTGFWTIALLSHTPTRDIITKLATV